MQELNFLNFSDIFSVFLTGFYLMFSLLYILYSIVYLHVVKILNRTVKTQHAWFFNFAAIIQLVLGVLAVFLGLSFFF